MNKAELLAKLSEELISEIESSSLSLEKIILKATKIARLDGDNEAHKWLRLELCGYKPDTRPRDITQEEAAVLAHRSNRYRFSIKDGKETWNYYIESVSGIESEIESGRAELAGISVPAQVTPVTTGFMHENFSTVLQQVRKNQREIKEFIKGRQSLLSGIRSGVYDYAYSLYAKYAFEAVTDTIFTQLKLQVDTQLQEIVPGALHLFNSAYNRLRDGDGEDLSQALSTCRNILKAFADSVHPASVGKIYTTSDGKVLKTTGNEYKNRIIAFLDLNSSSSSKDKLVKARAMDLAGRLFHLQSQLSKGAKNNISKAEAQKYVIETYLLLADLLEYIPEGIQKDSATSLEAGD